MLKWENYVIQHEKMKKLREDIQDTFKISHDKMAVINNKLKDLKETLVYFNHICRIWNEWSA